MQSVRSRKPTSGLKFGPTFRCWANSSSQLVWYLNPAPTSVCPDETPGVRVCAAYAFTIRFLKKTRRVSAPLVWLESSRGLPERLSIPITPTYEPPQRERFTLITGPTRVPAHELEGRVTEKLVAFLKSDADVFDRLG